MRAWWVMMLLPIGGTGWAGDVLRVERVLAPRRVAAGTSAPIEVRFSVVEPLGDIWRVSMELAPIGDGERIVEGPAKSLFSAQMVAGVEKTYSFALAIPADAPPGTYRLIVDHYGKVDGAWAHVRYVDRDDKPMSVAIGELEVVEPLPQLPLPAPQRKLRAGEIHAVYECEEFEGMDGGGEDVGVAQGWTWHSDVHSSGLRAAVNSNGSGVIHAILDPPLPAGDYKLFLKAGSVGSTLRVGLDDEATEVTPLRNGWVETGAVTVGEPATRLWVEVVEKIGRYAIVDSIYVTNDLASEATRGRDPSRQFLPADAAPLKTGRTIYTNEYLAAMRDRVADHESLSDLADRIIESARSIAANTDEQLWGLMADTSIKREYYVNQNRGCPVCGLKIKEFEVFHPWILKPLERPFKMACPSCEGVFPSNDFAAGELTGGDYPDDGTGYAAGEDTYHFIGEYVHFAYRTGYQGKLRALTQGVVLTEDPEIAHKASVMVLRAAQQFPNSEDRQERAFKEHWGHRSGCVTDSIWSSYEGRQYGQAYDAVWPFLDADEELLALARREIPEIETPDDLRLYIEENLLRRVAQAYCDEAILGNAGYHHKGLAWLLLALDDDESTRFPNCRDLLEYVYYRIYGALRYFPNLLGRDGSSLESPGYNASRLNMVGATPVLERYFDQHPGVPRDRYPNMWDDPRFEAQFDYYTDYMLLDRWLPTVGDTTGGPVVPEPVARQKLSVVSPGIAAAAWAKYQTPKLATVAYGLDDKPPSPSLWEDLPLDELAAARADAPENLKRRTNVQDDYGLVFLRSGEGDAARVLWAWYGKTLSHAHDDKLMIGLVGKGVDLLPDLGYPKSWDHAGRWESNALTHNTITVDGVAFPAGRVRGQLQMLGNIPGLQVAEVAAGDVSRRLLAMVDVDDEDFYVVDLFDVRAGSEQTLSYHGPQATVVVGGVELEIQAGGTAAGADIAFGEPLVDAAGTETHTPLAHMTDVERGEPTGPYRIDYALGDEADTHVRLHQFPEAGTALVLGTGSPPSQPDAYRVRYGLQMRSGAAPLASRYLTVTEPYCVAPVLDSVERLAAGGFGGGEALRITRGDVTDLLMLASDAGQTVEAAGARLVGRAALARSEGDTPSEIRAYAFSSVEA
ncbi:MAG TPA: heparinase II/III family protein, partial [Armatimonadota bacterium]|nr:heparinase II/III family protein [Armatimonadota bacterium]